MPTDKKISELDAAGTIDGTELMELVQAGANVKSNPSDVVEAMLAVAVAPDGTIDDAIDAVIAAGLVAGVKQIETAIIVGTIGPAGAGDASVTVTAAGMTNSPKTISVAVANDDTASDVAGKIRTALIADADIGDPDTGFFTIGGASANVVLTANAEAANDATMNLAYDNDTCTGLTPDATSNDTLAGVAFGDIAGAIDTAVDALRAAAVTPLTNSTGGTPAATLVAVGDTSAGDESDAINDNFASLNQQIEDLKAAMVAAGTLTEFVS